MLPNVICPGFQKAGTTYLFSLLRQHPQIFLPKRKELHFFSEPKLRRKGISYYEGFFKDHQGEPVVMEVTPRYITSESFIVDMKEVLGSDLKFIIMVRDPMKRLVSHYRMRKARCKEKVSLTEVIKRGLLDNSDDYLEQVKRGIYSEQLNFLEKHFSRDQFHIVVLENFIKDPHSHLQNIMNFLHIDQGVEFDLNQPRNPGKGAHVNWFGKIYFAFPRRYHRKILHFFPEDFEGVYEKYLYNQSNSLPEEVIDSQVLSQLLPIYQKQKEILSNEYNLILDCWLTGY